MPEIRQRTDRKAPKSAFKPGQSGNPGGRPKKTQEEIDLIAACKSKAGAALETILQIMATGAEKNRLAAAQVVIERAYGKPVQPQDIDLKGHLAVASIRPKLTREEWLASLVK